jgi:hypothetical protein
MTYTLLLHSPRNTSYGALHLPLSIGRASRNHICLKDKKISRTHCRIFEKEGCLYLEDLRSQNGTYIAGKAISLRKLTCGVPFTIGTQSLTILEEQAQIFQSHWLLRIPPTSSFHWLHRTEESHSPASQKSSTLVKKSLPKIRRRRPAPVSSSLFFNPFLSAFLLLFTVLGLFSFFYGKKTTSFRFGKKLSEKKEPRLAYQTPALSKSIQKGIDYLLRHQDPEGFWDPVIYTQNCSPEEPCRERGEAYYRIGITSLVIQVLLKENPSRFEGALERGLSFLVAQQQSQGLFGSALGKYTYNHALATLALAQALDWKSKESWKLALKKAFITIIALQNQDGGWRYGIHSQEKSDLSVSVWMFRALKESERHGLAIPALVLERFRSFLATRFDATQGVGGYLSASDGGSLGLGSSVEETMTALALWTKVQLHEEIPSTSVLRLKKTIPDPQSLNYYYWYQGALALQVSDPEGFQYWMAVLSTFLLALQDNQGCGEGSFLPKDPWSDVGARLYSTSMALLLLQTLPQAPKE